MIYKNICCKRTYMKDNKEMAKWFVVGTFKVTDEGKEFIELNMFPNTPFYVFEQKKKEEDQGEF